MLKTIRLFTLFITILVSFHACQNVPDKPKYVFLFIGDGMGVAQVNLTEAYLAAVNHEKGFKHLSFTQFPHAGLVSTYANNRFITCSAAAGTAFATGYKTNINHISTDSSTKVPFKSIATMCKELGMKVGILSSVSIDHATPAVFYAHQPTRNNYFEIGIDLSDSDFDFFGGGGFKSPVGTLDGSEINLYEHIVSKGFTYINDFNGLTKLQPGDGKVLAVYPKLLESGAMPYVIDKPDGPSLAGFTAKAIEYLDNENGFFMMVEGGKIDWACHSNDAATSIHETIAFDDAVQAAITFYDKHPNETLIIVTADHETGGLALGADKTGYETYFELLQYQKISVDNFNLLLDDFRINLSGNYDIDLNKLLNLVDNNFGLGSKIPLTGDEKSALWFSFEKSLKQVEAETKTYSKFPALTEAVIKLVSEKAGVGWTTYAHTGINIPIYAIGPGAEKFTGTIDNTDIPKILIEQLGIED